MASTKSSKTNNTSDKKKISMCRSFLGNELKSRGFRVHGLYVCRFGSSCKEAHSWSELQMMPHIREWNTMLDKSSIDLLSIRKNIIDVITQSRDSIKNSKFASMIHTIHRIELVELFQYMYDLICHQRRIAKELPSRKTQGSEAPGIGVDGYKYKEDVPLLYLENEDIFWALQRTLHPCAAYLRMISNKDVSHPATAICCGEDNCKHGEHDKTRIACVKDMITGSCDCSKHAQDIERLESEISELNKQLEDSVDSDGFQVKLSKKVRDEILQKISLLKKEQSMIPEPRVLHYSKQGMIPYSQRVAENELRVKEKAEVDLAKLELVAPAKKIVKKVYSN